LIVTGGTDGIVRVWQVGKAEADKPTLLRKCGEKTKEITDADFSPDGKLLAAVDLTGVCRLFDLAKDEKDEGQVLTYSTPAVKGRIFIKS